MVEAVLGKWQVDLSTITGLDEFGAAMGFQAEQIEMFRKLSYTVEFSLAGDTYTSVVAFATDAVPVQTYTFQLGQTFDFHAADGTTPKLTVSVDGGKLVEKYKLGDKEWETVREVDGNVMTSTTTFVGKSVTQKLNKV
ncbi:fatty acid-binding protein, liver-like isoform X2 [Babylonia areolata]|uniref:fatty acid-binding protein, liver-like isoform X2 n=1 Tax=Babylonia areolata TaxID=304850 RepID=UPI003FD65E69